MRVHKFWRKGERSGRASLYTEKHDSIIEAEVAFLTHHYGVGVAFGDGESADSVKFSFMAGLGCLWIEIPGVARMKRGMDFSLRFFDGGAWLNTGADPNESSTRDPWWRKTRVFRPLDALLGQPEHGVVRLVEKRDVLIPMPEATYPAHIEILDEEWRRARWPFAQKIRRAHIDAPGGVPHAGKWGEDGLYGLTTALSGYGAKRHPIEDGIGAVVASVLADRWRHSRDHAATGKRETGTDTAVPH